MSSSDETSAPIAACPQPPDADAASSSLRCVFVQNLARSTTEVDLTNFFSGFALEKMYMPTNSYGRCSGVALVIFRNSADCLLALSQLRGKVIAEREVRMELIRGAQALREPLGGVLAE